MGIFHAQVDNNFASDAEYQAFFQAIEAAYLASGFWEVAPDTGQLDLATMVRPAINVFGGYRMYRAKDPLQASKPLYMKLSFGLAGALDRPKLERSLGTGSNGSGTLTGPTQAAQTILTPAQSGTGVSYICGGGGEHDSVVWAYDPGTAAMSFAHIVGRLMNQLDGEVNADSVAYDSYSASSGSTLGSTAVATDHSGAWTSLGSSAMAEYFPNLAASLHSGADLFTALLYQAMVYRNGKTMTFPLLLGKTADLAVAVATPGDSSFGMEVWGEMRTFIPIPFHAHSQGNRYCMQWEV
jgi:hypothetical protein